MKVFSPSSALGCGAILLLNSLGSSEAADCTLGSGTQKSVTLAAAGESPRISRDTAVCAQGEVPYLKSITVVPAAAASGETATDIGSTVLMKLYDGVSTTEVTPAPEADPCTKGIKYLDVGKTASRTSDVSAVIKCSAACKVSYIAEWGCYTPLFKSGVTKTFKRTDAKGTGCTNSDDACVDRCFRSLNATTDATTTKLKSAFTPSGCSDACTDLVVSTVKADGVSGSATGLTVTFDGTTLTVDQTGTKVCKSTYTVGAYANPFVADTYTRSAVDPTSCEADTCDFKCAAELGVTTSNDDVTGKPAPVANCPCPSLAAVVSGTAAATGKNGTTTYAWAKTTGGFEITTTVGSSTPCKATYATKQAASPSTPAPSSGGVSVNTIWAMAATAVFAVAGVVVMA